jgi:hypothetical protein
VPHDNSIASSIQLDSSVERGRHLYSLFRGFGSIKPLQMCRIVKIMEMQFPEPYPDEALQAMGYWVTTCLELLRVIQFYNYHQSPEIVDRILFVMARYAHG